MSRPWRAGEQLVPPAGPSRLERVLHPATLVSLAVAQPLFDLLRQYSPLLVAHRLGAVELVALAALLGFGLPLLAGLASLASGAFGRRPAAAAYAVAIGVPVALAGLQLAKQLGLENPAAAIGLALAAGAGLAWLALARRPVRQTLTLLAPVLLLFPALFLLRPPVAGLLRQPAAAPPREAGPELRPTPVVLLVLDELPLASLLDAEGRIDAPRFPGFAALAETATWYRNAATVSPQTTWAVPALLTGRFPEGDRLPVLRDYPDNLLAWMSRRVPTHSFEALTALRPGVRGGASTDDSGARRLRAAIADLALVFLHRVLPPDLATGWPPVTDQWGDFWATGHERGGVPGQVERFLAGVRPTDGAAFYFAHFNLPHLPWRYLPSGREYGPPGTSFHPPGLVGESWRPEEWPVIAGWQRHLLQVGYADRVVAELTAALRRSDLWERALVIVVADHGASFWPGRSRRNVDANLDDLARIPLWVKFPGQRAGAVDDRPAATVDVVPTVAGVLGIPSPWPVDGVSLLAPPAAERTLRLCHRRRPRPLLCEDFALAPFDPRAGAFAETLARQSQWFGDGEDPRRLFRLGPWAELVGRPVAAWGAAAPSPLVLRLDEPASFAAVDPASGFVPALVSGAVDDAGGQPLPVDLAIAVNGTIAAVTRSFPRPPDWTAHDFAAMVPEEVLVPGGNRIEVFHLRGTPAAPQPAPVTVRGAVRWRLVAASDGRVAAVEDLEGRRVEVEAEALRGSVQASRLDEGTWLGWAARGEPPKAAETVLVFAGDRYLAASAPGAAGVLQLTGGPVGCGCGFTFVVPTGLLTPEERERLRFFAVAGGRATELAMRARAPARTAAPAAP